MTAKAFLKGEAPRRGKRRVRVAPGGARRENTAHKPHRKKKTFLGIWRKLEGIRKKWRLLKK